MKIRYIEPHELHSPTIGLYAEQRLDKLALVLLSGGQDSMTCLFHAKRKYKHVNAIGFHYGQRHGVEIDAAAELCNRIGVPYHIYRIPPYFLGQSALTGTLGAVDVSEKHPDAPESLPASFVSGRNALFLLLSYIHAKKTKADVLVGGMCQTDYSGYPDCRLDFIANYMRALELGYGEGVDVELPLMFLSKAQTFLLSQQAGGLATVLELSRTCYRASPIKNPWGYGCGTCPACELRQRGWTEFQAMMQQ